MELLWYKMLVSSYVSSRWFVVDTIIWWQHDARHEWNACWLQTIFHLEMLNYSKLTLLKIKMGWSHRWQPVTFHVDFGNLQEGIPQKNPHYSIRFFPRIDPKSYPRQLDVRPPGLEMCDAHAWCVRQAGAPGLTGPGYGGTLRWHRPWRGWVLPGITDG